MCIGTNGKGVPKIGDNVELGYGCIIIGNISIADSCVIGAGSIVTKSISIPGSIVAGNPAKLIRIKNIEE